MREGGERKRDGWKRGQEKRQRGEKEDIELKRGQKMKGGKEEEKRKKNEKGEGKMRTEKREEKRIEGKRAVIVKEKRGVPIVAQQKRI